MTTTEGGPPDRLMEILERHEHCMPFECDLAYAAREAMRAWERAAALADERDEADCAASNFEAERDALQAENRQLRELLQGPRGFAAWR
jgi:hypothetical protein